MRNEAFTLPITLQLLPFLDNSLPGLCFQRETKSGLTAIIRIADVNIDEGGLEREENSGKGLRIEILLLSSQYSIVFWSFSSKGHLAYNVSHSETSRKSSFSLNTPAYPEVERSVPRKDSYNAIPFASVQNELEM